MGAFKSWATIALLGGVAYFAYTKLNQRDDRSEPAEVAEAGAPEWVSQPVVDLGAPAGAAPAAAPAHGGQAPSYEAPGYDPVVQMPPEQGSADPTAGAAGPFAPRQSPGAPQRRAQQPPGMQSAAAYNAEPYAAPQQPGDPYAAHQPADPYGASQQPASPYASANPADDPSAHQADPSASTAAADFPGVMVQVQAMLEAGHLTDAQLELSQWFDDPNLTPSQQQELVDLLDQLTGTVVYSQEHLLAPPHQVQPGETLPQIAESYQVPWQLLAKINGIDDPAQLPVGFPLKVVPGPFSALVELEKYRLTLWLGGRYAGRFPIGLGRDLPPAEGEFAVDRKEENPVYYGPDRVIPADDPSNPLGERWIGLAQQLGLHGTNDPASIGRNESRGSIRLAPQDVEDVYDMLIVGSRVRIQR